MKRCPMFCAMLFSGNPMGNQSRVTPANQTKKRPVHELFAGAFRNKSSICESCLFSQGKTPEFTKMGEIHELFVLPFSLVWFAGATPESTLQCETFSQIDPSYPIYRVSDHHHPWQQRR